MTDVVIVRTCDVCGNEIPAGVAFVHHSRLDADVCTGCPLTNVKGEDISAHTLLWFFPLESSKAE